MYEIYEELLKLNNVTTADVCRATGISQSTMSNWKKRRNALSTKNARLVARYFGVTVEYLMGGEDPNAVKFDESKIIRAYHATQESTTGKKYYFDDETAEIAQYLYENEGQRILFEASRGSKPEDLKIAADLLKRLKGESNG